MNNSGYPSHDFFDEKLYNDLTNLPNDEVLDVPWLKSKLWPETDSFEIPRSELICGMQANVFTLLLFNADKSVQKRFVVKRTRPKELPEKDNGEKWTPFVESVKNELDFFEEIANHQHLDDTFPKCFFKSQAPFSFTGRIRDEAFFVMIMEDLNKSHFQRGDLDREEAEAVLTKLAKFHADFWGQDIERRGSFWPLERRPEEDLKNADCNWKNMLSRFPAQLFSDVPEVEKLAGKCAVKAESLDKFVSEHCYTRIHGDCKAWNIFLGKEPQKSDVVFIDLAWSGKGHPFQDVAYVLTTSLQPEVLQNFDELVDFYVSKLVSYHKVKVPEDFRSHFDLVWLDYARVIVTGLWKNLSPERMEKYSKIVGPSMIGRSLDHVKFILQRIQRCLQLETVSNLQQ